jgi:DNA replication protein DnaC
MKLILPSYYKENNPNIIKTIREDFKDDKPFHYLFLGKAGCGKTELARIIYKSSATHHKNHNEYSFIKARELYWNYLDNLKDSNFGSNWIIKKNENAIKAPKLVFDDLGNEKPSTTSAREYIGTYLERRYDLINLNRVSNTIITTNLDQKGLYNLYGSRVLDRLEEMFTVMVFKKHSFRSEKRKVVKG